MCESEEEYSDGESGQ